MMEAAAAALRMLGVPQTFFPTASRRNHTINSQLSQG